MRGISLIVWIALAATTAIAFAATPSSAEARGFRLRPGVGSAAAATAVPATPRAIERLATAAIPFPIAPAAAAPRVPPRAERPEPVAALTPLSAAPASERARPSSQPVRVAGPRCPPDRIVGAGAGFCEIN